jgi:transposase
MKIFVGVDVGKMFLDVHINNNHLRVNNDKSGFKLIEREIKKNSQEHSSFIIVCEASGGYEKKLVSFFNSKGYDTHIAHANKVKAFARSKGYMAKTDKIDSKIIHEYATAMNVSNDEFQLSEGELSIKHLIVRREQLRTHKQQEKTRIDKCDDPIIVRSVQRLIKFLEKEIIALEKQLNEKQKTLGNVDKKVNLLCSIPSVGQLTAQYIVAYLPELGCVTNKALAALVGVAPYCRDSGKHSGNRFIQGGRQRLRNQLYMVAVSSIRHNHVLSNFYKRLREKGKPAKVALVAVIRKLLTILNSVIQRNSVWEERLDLG